MAVLGQQQLDVGRRRSQMRVAPVAPAAAVALAPAAALAVAPAAAAAVAVAPAAAVALAPAAAVALAASIAGLDLLRGLYFRDCNIKLLVSKLQWGRDVLAVRVQVHVPRVHGSRQPGGALPFTSIAAATMDRLPSTAAAVALAPAAAVALAPAAAVALATPVAGPDLLRGLCGDCDIKLLVSKLQWGRDVLAVRVQVHVPRVHCSREAGGALPFTTPAAAAAAAAAAADRGLAAAFAIACFHGGLRHLGQHVVGRR